MQTTSKVFGLHNFPSYKFCYIIQEYVSLLYSIYCQVYNYLKANYIRTKCSTKCTTNSWVLLLTINVEIIFKNVRDYDIR